MSYSHYQWIEEFPGNITQIISEPVGGVVPFEPRRGDMSVVNVI